MPIQLKRSELLADVPVPLAEIRKMIDYYIKTIQKTPNLKKEETRSLWVSRNEIEDLLKENPTANGIRIYFGRHYDTTIIGNQDCNDKLTVILVTTRDDVNPQTPSSGNSGDLLDDKSSVTMGGQYQNKGSDVMPPCPEVCPK